MITPIAMRMMAAVAPVVMAGFLFSVSRMPTEISLCVTVVGRRPTRPAPAPDVLSSRLLNENLTHASEGDKLGPRSRPRAERYGRWVRVGVWHFGRCGSARFMLTVIRKTAQAPSQLTERSLTCLEWTTAARSRAAVNRAA